MYKSIVLVGAFHEMIELIEDAKYYILGILDTKKSGFFYNYPIIGSDDTAAIVTKDLKNFVWILSPDKPGDRVKLRDYYHSIHSNFGTIVSPNAIVSKTAVLHEGVVIQAGVNISSNVKVGAFVKINSCANIMHDVVISNYSTIAPSAVILGNVTIGEQVYVGANATIMPGVSIGDRAIVGAGAVVTRNVQSNIIVKGIPAK